MCVIVIRANLGKHEENVTAHRVLENLYIYPSSLLYVCFATNSSVAKSLTLPLTAR